MAQGGQRGERARLCGHCYTASEAAYNQTHWFLRRKDGTVLDPTVGQFTCRVPYERSFGAGFLTKHPSRRAREVMRRALAKD